MALTEYSNGQSTALATTESSYRRQLEPQSLDALYKVAAEIAKIGLCGVASPQEALARMVAGRELGLSMMQSLRGVYLVEGRPSLDASLMQAIAEQQTECEYFECVESTDRVATYVTKKRGRPEQRYSFSIEDAQRAGLLDRGKDPSKNNWNKHPRDMLRARAKSGLARMAYPGALFGMYSREELADGDTIVIHQEPIRIETPAQVVQTKARDTEAECLELEERIRSATTRESRATVRKAIEAFASDVGEPLASRVKALYNELHARKAAAPPSAPASPDSDTEVES